MSDSKSGSKDNLNESNMPLLDDVSTTLKNVYLKYYFKLHVCLSINRNPLSVICNP